jgi:hypothetical protein
MNITANSNWTTTILNVIFLGLDLRGLMWSWGGVGGINVGELGVRKKDTKKQRFENLKPKKKFKMCEKSGIMTGWGYTNVY